MVRGDTWPPKSHHATPAGGPGAKAPRMVAKFSILKRFKVLKTNHSFKKINIFLARKIQIFYENFQKIEQFYKDFVIISKDYFTNFSFMEHPLNSEKFPLNSIIELRILSKNSKNRLDRGGILGKE